MSFLMEMTLSSMLIFSAFYGFCCQQNMTKDDATYADLLNEVFAAHSSLQGVPAARAELQYIKEVQLMDGYGCDFYLAKV